MSIPPQYIAQPVFLDAGFCFNGVNSGKTLKGYEKPGGYTPDSNPNYVFPVACRDVVVWFMMDRPEPLYLCGPAGCGKSSLIRELAARLNYPVFEVTGHDRLEYSDLVGHLTLRENSMAFDDGPLTLAMRLGGIFLFDEVDLCSPATLAGLNAILDGSPLCIPENSGELLKQNPMFRFVATANTNGGSDDTGLYQGTLQQNLAFIDRFMLVEMGYPSPDAEVTILKRLFPRLPSSLRLRMVEYANDVRAMFMGQADKLSGTIEVTLSTRTLIRWADLTIRYQPLARQGISPITHALDRALAFKASAPTRAMLHELAQRHFPHEEKQKQE